MPNKRTLDSVRRATERERAAATVTAERMRRAIDDGWSQREVAEAVGITQQAVSDRLRRRAG